MKEWQIKKGINSWGLPRKTKFIGYLLHLPESDEFLAQHRGSEDMDLWGWSPSPESAIKYSTQKAAKAIEQRYDKGISEVVALLDIGDRYLTIPLSDTKELSA